jgi:hypothetical protein
MSAGRYNGWANYETWCVHLWLTNEWDLYHEAVEVARRSSEPEAALDAWVRDCWPDSGSVEPNHLHGMFSDLIGTSLERVDWSGVAGAILEDAA